jgi:homoserine kinase
VLALASELEGHPDNAAAALLGGLVICADGAATRFDAPPGLEAILLIPHRAVRTIQARAALPSEIPMGDAVFNVAHAALLAYGPGSRDFDLITRGLRDRVHQPRRASLYPRSAEVIEYASELGALGATVSGAGPAVLVWTHCEATGVVLGASSGAGRGLGGSAARGLRAGGRRRAGVVIGVVDRSGGGGCHVNRRSWRS